jgi:hypothetical protein
MTPRTQYRSRAWRRTWIASLDLHDAPERREQTTTIFAPEPLVALLRQTLQTSMHRLDRREAVSPRLPLNSKVRWSRHIESHPR